MQNIGINVENDRLTRSMRISRMIIWYLAKYFATCCAITAARYAECISRYVKISVRADTRGINFARYKAALFTRENRAAIVHRWCISGGTDRIKSLIHNYNSHVRQIYPEIDYFIIKLLLSWMLRYFNSVWTNFPRYIAGDRLSIERTLHKVSLFLLRKCDSEIS